MATTVYGTEICNSDLFFFESQVLPTVDIDSFSESASYSSSVPHINVSRTEQSCNSLPYMECNMYHFYKW